MGCWGCNGTAYKISLHGVLHVLLAPVRVCPATSCSPLRHYGFLSRLHEEPLDAEGGLVGPGGICIAQDVGWEEGVAQRKTEKAQQITYGSLQLKTASKKKIS